MSTDVGVQVSSLAPLKKPLKMLENPVNSTVFCFMSEKHNIHFNTSKYTEIHSSRHSKYTVKSRGIFHPRQFYYLLFLCLSAEVKGNHHQHDVVYVISIYFSYYGKIAPNSDNGKCDDGFYLNNYCPTDEEDDLVIADTVFDSAADTEEYF